MVKIFKTSLSAFESECSSGDACRQAAYLAVLRSVKPGDRMDEDGTPRSATVIEITVSSWNREGRVVEWRYMIGMFPALDFNGAENLRNAYEDKIEEFFARGQSLAKRLRSQLERSFEIREGVVSEEPVYGSMSDQCEEA